MFFSADMKTLLGLFEEHGVHYALVGGHAVNYHGYVRATQDMDVLVLPTADFLLAGKTDLLARIFVEDLEIAQVLCPSGCSLV